MPLPHFRADGISDVHHFEIDVALKGIGTIIKMDGRPLHGIRMVKVCAGLDTLSTVTLEFTATATISGEAQVWVRDLQQGLRERAVAAEHRADKAEFRADKAEHRADTAESAPSFRPEDATLAYIVPVPKEEDPNI